MEQQEQPARLHALDNLRAIMMWLGIVIHASIMHMAVENTQVPWIDTHRSIVADIVAITIHAFRMPVFLILAGFFCAMLVDRRGINGMLSNRMKRLALPFAIFWPIVSGLVLLAGVAYLNLMVFGRWGLDLSALPAHLQKEPNTIHMWFLWHLIWLCLATALLMRLPQQPFRHLASLLRLLARSPWGFAVLAIPIALAGLGYRHAIVEVGGSLLPPWKEWLYSGMYFSFGLAFYGARAELFALFQNKRKAYAIAGAAVYLAGVIAHRFFGFGIVTGYTYACAGWLWSFALIGYALHGMSRPHPVLGYLADSAYWVYLLHMPVVVFFGAVMYGAPIFAELKILINIALTSAVCLGTYALFVRHTWISVLLNGKRHPRRQPPPAATAAAG